MTQPSRNRSESPPPGSADIAGAADLPTTSATPSYHSATPAGNATGVDRVISLSLFAIAATMLGFYMTITYRALFHSDAAMKLLLAEEMARQFTLFPRGWNYVNDIIIVFPTLIAAPLSLVFPPSSPLHAIVDVIAAGCVLYAAYVASRAVGVDGPLRWLLPTLLASGLSSEFAEAVFGQSAYSGTLFILLLIGGWGARYLESHAQQDLRSRRDLLGIAVLLAAGVAGGQRGLASYAVPFLIAVLGFHIFGGFDPTLRQRATRLLGVTLVATIIGGLAFYLLLRIVDFHEGAAAQSFSDSAHIVNHLQVITRNWFELFAALPPAGNKFSALAAAVYAARLAFALIVFFLPLALLSGLSSVSSATLRFLLLLQAGILIVTLYVLIFTGVMVDEAHGSPRYLAPMVPISLLILLVWLKDSARGWRINATRIGWTVSASMLALSPQQLVSPAFSNWPNVAQGIRLNPRSAIVTALQEAGLHYGFAGYWNASALTVLSGSDVRVAPVTMSDGSLLTPFHHLTAERWYGAEWTKGPTFLLLDASESQTLNRPALDAVLGPPSKILQVNGYDILIYPFNLGERIGFSPQPHVTIPLTPASCSAEYRVLDQNLKLAPHAFGVVRVQATNLSGVTWSQNSIPYLNPGLRVVDTKGTEVAEFRALLPQAVPPGGSTTLTMPFRAPEEGEYTVYFSIVIEGYAWCGNSSANWAIVPLSVKP